MITSESIEAEKQLLMNQNGDEISIIDVITAIGEGKRIIVWIVFISILIGTGISLVMPSIYTAKTTFLPPQQSQSEASTALASLGGVAGFAAGALGIKSPDEMYVALLQSETLQNNLIQEFKLQTLEQKTLSDTRNALKSRTKIIADKKSGIVSIEVDDKSPTLAAQLANAYVEQLRKLLDHLAVTEAQQKRMFFEQLITKTKESLATAELASKKAQETSGIVSLDEQTTSTIKVAAELRAQIALREVQIHAISSYATSQNSDMQRLVAELDSLRIQLEKLERGAGHNENEGKSRDALANLRAFREVKYQEAVLDTLVKQYELARIQEAKEGPLIQQVDIATPPEKRSRPKRTVIIFIALLGGFILGLIIVFIRRELRRAAVDPLHIHRIQALRHAWGLKNEDK
jgi:uncharacterized protein involved in exopolysaccharide biosynthesis